MPNTIRDGKGRGYQAAVNSENQLVTRSTIVEQRLKAAIDAKYYEASTGRIDCTDDAESAILYLKNETTFTNEVMVIDRVFYDMWTSTGGTGEDGYLKYYRNPTITGGTDIEPVNTNFSSSETAPGTFKRSPTIDTSSGTVWWTAYHSDRTSVALEEGRIVIPSGYSFAISVACPTGNTSMFVSINVAFYYLDTTLLD
jgi:hypothetical protein